MTPLAVRRPVRSDDPDHWYLGFALIANGKPDEAITVLERALGTDRTKSQQSHFEQNSSSLLADQ